MIHTTSDIADHIVPNAQCIYFLFVSLSFSFALHHSGILFTFLFPILQCTCFYLAIGDNPKDLMLGIVNDEVPNWNECFNDSLVTTRIRDEFECDLMKTSCRYLRGIPSDVAKQVRFVECGNVLTDSHMLLSFPISSDSNYGQLFRTDSFMTVTSDSIRRDKCIFHYRPALESNVYSKVHIEN